MVVSSTSAHLGNRHATVGFPASQLAFQILLANASGDQRVGPQQIVINHIFVSQAETINPLPDEIEYGMFDQFLIAMIGKTLGIPLEHAKHSIDLSDQRHAAVADNISPLQNRWSKPARRAREIRSVIRDTVFARGNLHDLS